MSAPEIDRLAGDLQALVLSAGDVSSRFRQTVQSRVNHCYFTTLDMDITDLATELDDPSHPTCVDPTRMVFVSHDQLRRTLAIASLKSQWHGIIKRHGGIIAIKELVREHRIKVV